MDQPHMDRRLAARLVEKKARLDQMRPLHPAVVQRLYEDLRVLLSYHSNAIEGSTLSLFETKVVIEEGLTVGGHTLKEHLAAVNHAEALDLVRDLTDADRPITRDVVLQLHRVMMDRLLPDAGQFRAGQVHIRGSAHIPPHPRQVPGLMGDWVTWLDGEGAQLPPVTRAAVAHVGFAAIHPFSDGNGRVGRLILNLMLMRAGYPPALLLQEWRIGYMQALATAQTGGSYGPIVNLIGRSVEQALDRYLESILASDDALLPLAALGPLTGFKPEYLSWLIRQGRLPGRSAASAGTTRRPRSSATGRRPPSARIRATTGRRRERVRRVSRSSVNASFCLQCWRGRTWPAARVACAQHVQHNYRPDLRRTLAFPRDG